jgi:hypothetical protein
LRLRRSLAQREDGEQQRSDQAKTHVRFIITLASSGVEFGPGERISPLNLTLARFAMGPLPAAAVLQPLSPVRNPTNVDFKNISGVLQWTIHSMSHNGPCKVCHQPSTGTPER